MGFNAALCACHKGDLVSWEKWKEFGHRVERLDEQNITELISTSTAGNDTQ
jgi:plastocyanin